MTISASDDCPDYVAFRLRYEQERKDRFVSRFVQGVRVLANHPAAIPVIVASLLYSMRSALKNNNTYNGIKFYSTGRVKEDLWFADLADMLLMEGTGYNGF